MYSVIKYGDWVRETLLDILERVDCFPKAKYWKSTQPKHIELATNIIEEIIIPINQSITEFEVEIQFDIMQLLATQICEHLLKYMKQTDYRYSTQVRIDNTAKSYRDRKLLSRDFTWKFFLQKCETQVHKWPVCYYF